MEKRVYSLSKSSEKELLAVALIGYLPILGMSVLLGYLTHDPQYIYVGFVTVVFLHAVCWANLRANKMRKLETSDQGLLLERWLCKPVGIDWSAIIAVHVVAEPYGACHGPSALVRDDAGHRILIHCLCRDSKEIVEALRQHLPESVFVAR